MDGEGVIFNFIADFEDNVGLEFNKIPYLKDAGSTTSGIRVRILDQDVKLTENDFSVSLIMNENTISSDSETIAKGFTISASISLDNTVLSSSKVTETESILCYSGEKNYTIIAKRASLNGEECYTTFSDYSVLECGLMLYSKNVSLIYFGDLEVSIYSNSLSIEELEEISANIVVNE